jgi:hypothetical protein
LWQSYNSFNLTSSPHHPFRRLDLGNNLCGFIATLFLGSFFVLAEYNPVITFIELSPRHLFPCWDLGDNCHAAFGI